MSNYFDHLLLLMQELLPVFCSIAGGVFIFQRDNEPAHHTHDTVELLCNDATCSSIMTYGEPTVLTLIQWITACIPRACQFTQPMSIADACLHTSAAGGRQRYYLTLAQRLRLLFVNKLNCVKFGDLHGIQPQYHAHASAVLGVIILSVRLSVCLSHACFVTNPKNLPAIFLYNTKGQSF